METLEKIPAWHLTKVRNKKDVIDEARNNGRKVHFASLVDLCHLKNLELECHDPEPILTDLLSQRMTRTNRDVWTSSFLLSEHMW